MSARFFKNLEFNWLSISLFQAYKLLAAVRKSAAAKYVLRGVNAIPRRASFLFCRVHFCFLFCIASRQTGRLEEARALQAIMGEKGLRDEPKEPVSAGD